MPQPRVLDLTERPREPSGLDKFFSNVAEVYREGRDQDEFNKLVSQYQQNQDKEGAFENLQLELAKSNKLSPGKRLEAQQQLNAIRTGNINEAKTIQKQAKELQIADEKRRKDQQEVDKKTAEKEASTAENEAVLTQAGFPPEEVTRLSPILSPAGARSLATSYSKTPPKGPKEKFEETLAAKGAGEVGDLEKEVAKGGDTLANIERIDKLSTENLQGIVGYGKALFNTEAAAELKTLSATNLGTVIKLFNPVGQLPVSKLEWIRNTFSLSPWDNQSTVKGKLNTQRTITNQAIARGKQRLSLLKKYHGNIPDDVSKEFDDETGTLLDAMKGELEPKISREGMVQLADPNGVLRWVPKELADKLKG